MHLFSYFERGNAIYISINQLICLLNKMMKNIVWSQVVFFLIFRH